MGLTGLAGPKVLIDSRRKVSCGIGRASQWISNRLAPKLSRFAEVTHLVVPDAMREYEVGGRQLLCTDILPFSNAEFTELPALIEKACFDLYINPHVTWSPNHRVPTINIIHDFWTIERGDLLPQPSELQNRFHISDMSYGMALLKWFSQAELSNYLTPFAQEQWNRSERRGNHLERASWAQYAIMVAHSAATVTVSTSLQERARSYFPRVDRLVPICYVPTDFGFNRRHHPKHFLTLAKLEPRKGLEHLLDAYSLYAQTLGDGALSLVIAGDPGYASYAKAFHAKVASLKSAGNNIHFIESASDRELASLFSSAAALVSTSVWESFGLPPLEAMLAGVPVISTSTGMMSTNLGRYAIIVAAGDVTGLRDRLIDITVTPQPIQKLLEARQAVQTFVSENDAETRWLSLVGELLGTGSVAASS